MKLENALPNEYDTIIKALKLYMSCVIGADELFDFIHSAFGDEVELFEFFKHICLSKEIS